MGIVVLSRWVGDLDPAVDWTIVVLVGALVCAPLGFLLGLGSFDYWLYWISGRRPGPTIIPGTAPTRGRTTSGSTPITR